LEPGQHVVCMGVSWSYSFKTGGSISKRPQLSHLVVM